jgi:hypothetical protein
MRICYNCAFREAKKKKTMDLCIKIGNLCRVLFADPESQGCTEHQFSEAALRPVADAAVELLYSVRVTMSPALEKKALQIINAHSHLCIRPTQKGSINHASWRVVD